MSTPKRLPAPSQETKRGPFSNWVDFSLVDDPASPPSPEDIRAEEEDRHKSLCLEANIRKASRYYLRMKPEFLSHVVNENHHGLIDEYALGALNALLSAKDDESRRIVCFLMAASDLGLEAQGVELSSAICEMSSSLIRDKTEKAAMASRPVRDARTKSVILLYCFSPSPYGRRYLKCLSDIAGIPRRLRDLARDLADRTLDPKAPGHRTRIFAGLEGKPAGAGIDVMPASAPCPGTVEFAGLPPKKKYRALMATHPRMTVKEVCAQYGFKRSSVYRWKNEMAKEISSTPRNSLSGHRLKDHPQSIEAVSE